MDIYQKPFKRVFNKQTFNFKTKNMYEINQNTTEIISVVF